MTTTNLKPLYVNPHKNSRIVPDLASGLNQIGDFDFFLFVLDTKRTESLGAACFSINVNS